MAQTKDRPVEKADPETRSTFPGMSPEAAAAVYAAHLKRNIEARDRMIEEFGSRTPEEVAAAGIPAGAVLSVRYRDAEVIPGFQFDEHGHPLPVMADVLAILRDVRTPWEIALWFTFANGWLDGDRPVDYLRTQPEEVIAAARREAEELVV